MNDSIANPDISVLAQYSPDRCRAIPPRWVKTQVSFLSQPHGKHEATSDEKLTHKGHTVEDHHHLPCRGGWRGPRTCIFRGRRRASVHPRHALRNLCFGCGSDEAVRMPIRRTPSPTPPAQRHRARQTIRITTMFTERPHDSPQLPDRRRCRPAVYYDSGLKTRSSFRGPSRTDCRSMTLLCSGIIRP